MPHEWHPQALRAQAVVARSYTLATLRPGKLFDLYDDQRSQVYGGVRAEALQSHLAVGATANRVLTYGGVIATTYYHSTSGGRTAQRRGHLDGDNPPTCGPSPIRSTGSRRTTAGGRSGSTSGR